MNRLLWAIVAACMTACASHAPTPPNPAIVEFMSWAKVTSARVDAGEVKFSDFFKQSYERFGALPGDHQVKLIYLQMYAELIPIARKYEAGEISKEQFDDERRLRRMAAAQKKEALAEHRRQIEADVLNDLANSIQTPTYTDCTRSFGTVNCITR